MATQPHRPDGKTFWAAVTTVAAVYVYFLIFAQFGFLKAANTALGENVSAIRPLMAAMGFGGIAGSFAAARGFSVSGGHRWFVMGLVCCAVSAAGSWMVRGPVGFSAVALFTGLGVGLITVTLAGRLRLAVGDARLGLSIGLGTGLAYGFCNLPGIFGADATLQAGFALIAAIISAIAGRALRPRIPVPADSHKDHAAPAIAAWTLVFLALVCLDSALFLFIQQTPRLKAALWTEPWQQGLNAMVHVVAAALSGWMLDRGWLGRLMAVAAGILVWAAVRLGGTQEPAAVMAWLYIAAVSVYSTALVFYPARSGRPGVAAFLYAIAGWGGSGAGVMFAEGRAELPMLLPVVCAGLVVVALGWLRRGAGK